MPRHAKPPKTKQVTIRVPLVDLERVKAETERLSALRFSRTDLLRMAISMGLNAIEAMTFGGTVAPNVALKRGK